MHFVEHPDKAGLLFVSSVCLGLLLVLLAISMRITCNRYLEGASCLNKKAVTVEPKDEDEDDDSDDEESEPLMDSSMMSELGRKVYCWEEAMYTTEAAELIERLERREMIIQEIRMNAYLNGTSCTLHWYTLAVLLDKMDTCERVKSECKRLKESSAGLITVWSLDKFITCASYLIHWLYYGVIKQWIKDANKY